MSHDNQLPKEEERTTEKLSTKERVSFVSTLNEVLTKLCEAYRAELTPTLVTTWGMALDDMSTELLHIGCAQTLKRHQDFLPTPAQFRTYVEDAASKLPKPPDQPVDKFRRLNVLDEVREIARELRKGYDKLDERKDSEEIMRVMRKANIVRYLRAGVEPAWISSAEMEEARKFA